MISLYENHRCDQQQFTGNKTKATKKDPNNKLLTNYTSIQTPNNATRLSSETKYIVLLDKDASEGYDYHLVGENTKTLVETRQQNKTEMDDKKEGLSIQFPELRPYYDENRKRSRDKIVMFAVFSVFVFGLLMFVFFILREK